MKCSEVMKKLEKLSPTTFAEKWDNVGLILGRRDKEIKTVYITVDVTMEVVEEAIQNGVDLIISHHPLVFVGMKQITDSNTYGEKVLRLLQHDICCYALHTNFDVMGMADAAADELGLENREVLVPTYEDAIAKEGFGRIGRFTKELTLASCAKLVKEKLQAQVVLVYGERDRIIERVAILPGSGGDYLEDAIAKEADLMITGDIKHHAAMDAMEGGLCVIDAGHFETEKIFLPYMSEYMKRELPELSVIVANQKSPFWVL